MLSRGRASRDRIKAVAEALSRIPIAAVEIVETSDPQYAAVKKIHLAHGRAAAALVVANALISYRLSTPGEEYWQEFARYMAAQKTPSDVDELIELFESFLRISRGNRMLVQQKLKRLIKAREVLARLLEEPDRYLNLSRLVQDLTTVYTGKGTEKTIVFAAKMLHYLHLAQGVEEEGVNEIPVPIDRRMALLSYTSGILDMEPAEVMTKGRDEAVKAWLEVAHLSGIPSISLDAVVWLPAQRIDKLLRRGVDYARDEYARRLVNYTRGLVRWGTARLVARELIYRGIG
jgi:DNA-(apurinic or apyrimidinic site) lyase